MSANLVNLFTTQFSTNLELKLQQQTSMLRGRVTTGSHVGRQASPVQYMNPIKMQTPAGRFSPIGRVDTDFTRRWVFPADKDLPQLVDRFDELRTLNDPKSQYATNAAAAVAREWDDILIASAFATAYVGVGSDNAALTAETFSTSDYQIASTFGASAATGLTVPKLVELKRLLRRNHVDIDAEGVTIVAGSQQESDLLNSAIVTSRDFNEKPVLVDGRVTRFMGFDFVWSERLSTASNVRNCIAFAKSGLYLGMWMDTMNVISQRTDLSGHPWQIYTMLTAGATRLHPGKVMSILCSDTSAVDITP
jgi:hypothetical protein